MYRCIVPMSLALLFVLCLAAPGRGDELVSGGGGSESEGLWVSTPNVRFRKDGPGVAFGLLRTPGDAPLYGYVVLIRGVTGKSVGFSGRATSDGKTAVSSLGLESGGRKWELVYRVVYDPTSKQSVIESLTLDGRPLDLTRGRVLLVAADKGWSLQQHDVDLRRAAAAATPRTLEEVEAQAKGLVTSLRDGSEVVRSFLK